MQTNLPQRDNEEKTTQAVLAVLAFFSLYGLPVSSARVWELLYKQSASFEEISSVLHDLAQQGKIFERNGLFGLKMWDEKTYVENQQEIERKWKIVEKYFFVLSILPFVDHLAIINSLALGTADADSDIDFFVHTKKSRLYFVRSMIIVVFRILGIYKTRESIKDRFCFGFFVSQNSLNLKNLLIQPEDPYFVYWLANLRPILNQAGYEMLMAENLWLKEYFPNFDSKARLATIRQSGILTKILKTFFEILLILPAIILEPLLAKIHIDHTFKLPENKSAHSTTIANRNMLKLHASDVRADIAKRYFEVLQSRR